MKPSALLYQADAVLRGGFVYASDAECSVEHSLRSRLVVGLVFGMFYGAVDGAYGGLHEDRSLQVLYSALKLPLLLTAAFLLSLPTFFVLNTLFGLRSDFPRVIGACCPRRPG